jgi:hypothetical protein
VALAAHPAPTVIHGSPPAVGDPHTAGAGVGDRVVEAAQCRAEPVLKVGDECAGVLRLAQRRVVHVAVVFEVGGQVVFGIAPAVGADDGDLAAADRVSERTQHAQLVGDALDPAVVVDDRGAPLARHDTIDRHGLRGGVETVLAGPLRIPGQQLERVHDRAVAGVGAAKLQGGQEPRQHPAVVRGVRRAQHRPDALAKRLIVGLGLPHEVAQRALPDDRKQRRADGVVGMLERGLGEAKQDALLAAHATQIADQLTLDTVLRARPDAMHELDQQIDERVGDLRRPRPAQRGRNVRRTGSPAARRSDRYSFAARARHAAT